MRATHPGVYGRRSPLAHENAAKEIRIECKEAVEDGEGIAVKNPHVRAGAGTGAREDILPAIGVAVHGADADAAQKHRIGEEAPQQGSQMPKPEGARARKKKKCKRVGRRRL